MNPEQVPQFIEKVFKKMDEWPDFGPLPFKLTEFPLKNQSKERNREFRTFIQKRLNEVAKKSLIEFFESNEDITPKEVFESFLHMQAYEWEIHPSPNLPVECALEELSNE